MADSNTSWLTSWLVARPQGLRNQLASVVDVCGYPNSMMVIPTIPSRYLLSTRRKSHCRVSQRVLQMQEGRVLQMQEGRVLQMQEGQMLQMQEGQPAVAHGHYARLRQGHR